jgi:hypothetical protein
MINRILICFAILLWVSNTAYAQNESDERVTLYPKRGIRYLSKDSSFSVAFRFRLQNQASLQTLSAQNLTLSQSEARIRRLRMRIEGFLVNPKLTYYIQLAFSRADLDVREDIPPNIARDAIVYYAPWSFLKLGFGQAKLPGNRQRVISSGNLEFAERSLANARFTIDRDFGLFTYFTFGLKRPLSVKTVISTGEGRNALDDNGRYCYTGRLEWLPFGRFFNEGDYSEGDWDLSEKPKLSVGATFSYNVKTTQTGGQLGVPLYRPTDIRSGFIDLMFKYKGLSLLGEFFYRSTPGSPQEQTAKPTLYVYSGNGLNLQIGKMIGRKNECVFRYCYVMPEEKIKQYQKRNDLFTLGYNRFVEGHRVKIQGNLNYFTQLGNYSTSNALNSWGLIFQIEVGI